MLLATASPPVRADLVGAINELRAHGCAGKSGAKPPLRAAASLDDAARRMARGSAEREAMSDAGYRAVTWALIHVSGTAEDQAVARLVGERFCDQVAQAAFRHIGVARRGDETWIVLAAPFSAPAPGDARAVSRRVLELVNQARARARRCGRATLAAAAPLKLAPALERAALAHARDMAAHDYFSHAGRDGSTPAARVTRAGYRWRAAGENIAAGPPTPEAVMNGWLASPEHCANLMSADYTEMGVAYAVNPNSASGIYWVQEFAAPR